jgi:hypothetical protein
MRRREVEVNYIDECEEPNRWHSHDQKNQTGTQEESQTMNKNSYSLKSAFDMKTLQESSLNRHIVTHDCIGLFNALLHVMLAPEFGYLNIDMGEGWRWESVRPAEDIL